jgi:hypothetical protein
MCLPWIAPSMQRIVQAASPLRPPRIAATSFTDKVDRKSIACG